MNKSLSMVALWKWAKCGLLGAFVWCIIFVLPLVQDLFLKGETLRLQSREFTQSGLIHEWTRSIVQEEYAQSAAFKFVTDYQASIRNQTRASAVPKDQNETSVSATNETFEILYFPPVIPPALAAVMKDQCLSEPCFAAVRDPSGFAQWSASFEQGRLEGWGKGAGKWHKETLVLENAVIGERGEVSLCNGTIFGSYGCSEEVSHPNCGAALPVHELVIVISQYWGDNFYHSMLECLPRLAQALVEMPALLERPNDVSVHMMVSTGSQMLELLGLKHMISGEVRGKRVIVPQPTPCGGHVAGPANSRLRALLRFGLAPIENRNNLVLIRRDGGTRSISNHGVLLETVRKRWRRGAVIEHTGQGSLREQLSMFATASVAMGPHGAGLSNMVVMSAGSTVVEFLPVDGVNRLNVCYLTLASSLGLRYIATFTSGSHSEGAWDVDMAGVEQLTIFEAE